LTGNTDPSSVYGVQYPPMSIERTSHILLTTGPGCGFHCAHCIEGNDKKGIQTWEQENLECALSQAHSILSNATISSIRFAGQAGDFFFQYQDNPQDAVSIITTVSNFLEANGTDKSVIQISTHGMHVSDQLLEQLKPFSNRFLIIMSLDLFHHNGTQMCQKVVDNSSFVDHLDPDECKYFEKILDVAKMLENSLYSWSVFCVFSDCSVDFMQRIRQRLSDSGIPNDKVYFGEPVQSRNYDEVVNPETHIPYGASEKRVYLTLRNNTFEMSRSFAEQRAHSA